MNKKHDRRRLIIIAIIALLALLLGVGIYCMTQSRTIGIDDTETPLGGIVWDANAEEGGLVQRSEEEIRAELNEKVAKGMINISMNTSPVFENGTAEGNLLIVNSERNNYPQIVSDQVFTYVVCAVCPVKDASLELKYFHEQNEFHISSIGQTVGPTALGFLFPAFDDRAANIYNALYYAQKPAELHQEFIDAVFHTEAPMSSEEQREAFETALTDALERECSYEVAQTVHEQLRERIERHKEEKDPEPLSLSVGEIGAILKSGGVSEERVEAFTKECGEQFGENAVLNPGNLIDSKKFEVKTADVQLTVDPERSYLIETRVIDGRPYLLIPAEGVEVNGLAVSVGTESEPAEGKI